MCFLDAFRETIENVEKIKYFYDFNEYATFADNSNYHA